MKLATGTAAVCLAMATQAALAAPPGVTEREGAWRAPDGRALYTFARDVDGASSCNGSCATAWPPLLAEEGATAEGDWSIIDREDGSKMWAYKNKPVYMYARDAAGEPPSGVSATWPLAKK